MPNKLNTVQDLFDLIANHGGEIIIGKLSIKHTKGADLDVRIDGDLAAWSSVPDNGDVSVPVAELRMTAASYCNDMSHDQLHAQNLEQEGQLAEKTKLIATLEQSAKDASEVAGKVAAYEKLLIGRGVSITA